MRIRSADGTELALHDFGGHGDPLLMVHATGFCAGAYGPLAALLTSRFHVWGLDVRGHGDSAEPASHTMDWQEAADDVLAALEAIGPSRHGVVGFGHSMGGALLVEAQRRRPGVLRGAWLFEPIVTPPRDEWAATESPLSISARRRRRDFPSRDEALRRYAARSPLGVLRADCLAAYVTEGFRDTDEGVTLKCSPEWEATTFEATGTVVVGDLVDLDLPAVIARGERDDTTVGPAAMALAVADTLPGAVLQRFDHVGHFGPLQDPDTVAEAIIARFADVPGP